MEVVTRPRVSNYSVYNAGDYSIYMFVTAFNTIEIGTEYLLFIDQSVIFIYCSYQLSVRCTIAERKMLGTDDNLYIREPSFTTLGG